MMNNQKHKRNKFLFIVSLIITVIALLICFALWCSNSNAYTIASTFCVFACFEVAVLCISFFISLRIDKEWNFDKLGIV